MRNIEELNRSLKLYRDSLGQERLKVKESARLAVKEGQIRVLFWMPEEYVLVVNVEEEGLVHGIPLTVWVDLTTVPTKLYIKDKVFAPLPFIVYLRKGILEEESVPIAVVKEETVEKLLKAVEKSPTWSAIRQKREFLKLVWQRYQELTIGSILYTHIQREEKVKKEKQKAIIVSFLTSLYERHYQELQAYQRAAKTNALKGNNWLGVVEEGKAFIYLPQEYEGKRIRIKLFDSVIYEGEGTSKLIIENLPTELKSYEYLKEYLHVEILGD